MNDRRVAWIVFAAGLALRVWGLGFGLPFPYHPDENVVVGHAARIAETGDWRPATYHYPPLVIHVQAAAFDALRAGWSWLGLAPAGPPPGLHDAPTPYYLLARMLSALAGAAAGVVVYRSARRLVGLWPASIAGFVLALAPGFVLESHYGTVDAIATLLVALALDAAIRAGGCGPGFSPGSVAWFLAGWWSGLAAGAKYVTGLAILPAVVFRLRARSERHAGLWLLLGLGTGVAISWPHAILAPVPAIQKIIEEGIYVIGGYDPFGAYLGYDASRWLTGWIGYARVLGETYTWPLAALGMFGLLVPSSPKGERVWVRGALAAFVAAYLLLMVSWRHGGVRFALPLAPAIALGAGMGAAAVGRASFAGLKAPPILVAAAAVLLLGIAVARSVAADALVHREDTRTLAYRWLVAHIPRGAVVAREAYCPQIPDGPFRVVFEPILGRRDLRSYRREGVEYLVTSSFVSGAFTEKTRARFPGEYDFYHGLDRSAELVQRWTDRPFGFHHPEIRLYRLP